MDVAAEMPLLRSQLRSQLEEEDVASGAVAMRHWGSGSHRVRRQNAYATLCANFHRRFRVRSLPLLGIDLVSGLLSYVGLVKRH